MDIWISCFKISELVSVGLDCIPDIFLAHSIVSFIKSQDQSTEEESSELSNQLNRILKFKRMAKELERLTGRWALAFPLCWKAFFIGYSKKCRQVPVSAACLLSMNDLRYRGCGSINLSTVQSPPCLQWF